MPKYYEVMIDRAEYGDPGLTEWWPASGRQYKEHVQVIGLDGRPETPYLTERSVVIADPGGPWGNPVEHRDRIRALCEAQWERDHGHILTTKVVAQELGVNVSRVRQWAISGRLAATKIGRDWGIRVSDLEAFKATPRPAGRPWPKNRKTEQG